MTECIKLTVFVLVLALCGCVNFAAPPPLVTGGGPQPLPKNHSEVALALGTGLALFDDAHSGGSGWLGRWRYAVSDRLDFGMDMAGAAHGDTGTFNFKGATRYSINPRLRWEGSIGAADSSDGKSLSLESAMTVGPGGKNSQWNRYASLRFAMAKGYPEDALGEDSEGEVNTPPDTLFGLVNLGLTAKISKNQRFFFELGVGAVNPKDEDVGVLLFWGVGLLNVISQ